MQSPQNAHLVRASAIAAAWLLALTFLNIAAGGSMRGALWYATPVAFAAWHGARLGLVFAGLGTLSAWAGGAIAQPADVEPVWIEGLWVFLKLSAVVVWARYWIQYQRERRR